ncbi:hypothetical protein IY974_05555 [Campylobacter volucris]|uniref:hypothetical protein n=1 Tax=Campylobacter volucris TaxID=1031542 RepID=UPI00189D8C6D|nr:hypothetical protein [Campylobacter volucris]MBF7046024.1 hypothetical protein [Campylobacter volucris]
MAILKLNFNLKGTRTYIHGTDICDKLFSLYNKDIFDTFEISFHSINYNNIILSDKILKDFKEIKFLCKFNYKNNIKYLYGYENPDSKPKDSYPYEEEKITDNAIINFKDKSIQISQINNFSTIEKIVALNKHLLLNIFTKTEGKWYFTKLELKNPLPKNPKKINIYMQSNFNFLITKSAIYIEEKLVGYIYFSLH